MLDDLMSQLSTHEQQLSELTSICGDVVELSERVEVVKLVQNKVTELTSQMAATRKILFDTRTKVKVVFDEQQCNKVR